MGFSNPSVGNSSLQMNRSGKLFIQSYLNLESFGFYQCGYLWEQPPAGTTNYSQHFMQKYNRFKNVITAGLLHTSTQVGLLFCWCVTGFWEGCSALYRKDQGALMVTDLVLIRPHIYSHPFLLKPRHLPWAKITPFLWQWISRSSAKIL